jgi:hypothetical protein
MVLTAAAAMSDVELRQAISPEAKPAENVYGVTGGFAALHLGDLDEIKLGESQRQRLERVMKVIIRDLGFEQTLKDVSLMDVAIVRWAGTLVAERAAKLSGWPVAAISVQTGCASWEPTTVSRGRTMWVPTTS